MIRTYDPVQLFDMEFGPHLVSVTPVDCVIADGSQIQDKDRGKAPGRLTVSGWTGVSVNEPGWRCLDYATAKVWRDEWGANAGFVLGSGYGVWDNDEGEEFSGVLRSLFTNPLRRVVAHEKHKRDAFMFRVLDFVGDPVALNNLELSFRNGARVAKLSLLARGKQFVVAGVHPGTRAPYGWDRDLGLDQIPVLSTEEIRNHLGVLVTKLEALGWVCDKPPGDPVSGVSGVPPVPGVPPVLSKQPITPPSPALLHEARSLLAEIPNRDLEPGQTPTPVDDWLDIQPNWAMVAYALAAHFGDGRFSVEAQDVWLAWSNGRVQKSKSSFDLWRSIVSQPLRFGPLALVKLVRDLVPVEPEFPDIEPDDPILNVKLPVWDKLRSEWAYCPVQQKFVSLVTRETLSPEGFNGKFAYLADALDRELTPGRSRNKNVPTIASQLLHQPNRLEVRDLTYAPGDPVLIRDKPRQPPLFNLWFAPEITPRLSDDADIQIWLDHIEFILGSRSERDRFLRWCAFIVQFPKIKPNWHYLIMSVPGFGKDTMIMPLRLAVGAGNFIEQIISHLSGSFDYLREKKLIVFGETAQPKSEHAAAHDYSMKLNTILAAPPDTVSINKKGMHIYEIPNRVAAIMFSNEKNPLQMARKDRRVHVVNRLNQPVRGAAYYDALRAWLDNGGAELAAAHLMALPLTQAEQMEFLRPAPVSADKDALENANIHPHLAALEDLIDDARQGDKNGTPHTLVATALELTQMIRDRSMGSRPPTPRTISDWLFDMEGVQPVKSDPYRPRSCAMTGTNQHRGRIWFLSDKTADGRDWNSLTIREIVAIWKNLPAPPTATVIQHPANASATASQFPDEKV